MSNNTFKTNSRFNMLAQDTSITKLMNKNKNKNKTNELGKIKVEEKSIRSDDINSFKRPFYNDNRNQRNSLTNKYSKEQIDRISIEDKKRKEEKDKLDAQGISRALSIENFPSLAKIHKDNTCTTVINNTSFLEKLNTAIKDDKCNDNTDLEPGWVSITKDQLTGKTKILNKPSLYYTSLKHIKGETEIAYDVLYSLCNLHEKRTTEYIEMYGYDTWEKLFRYFEHDYEWVDKLDEKYEIEIEKLYEYDSYISDDDIYY